MGKKKPRHGKAVKKARIEHAALNEELFKKVPHSFVFHRGRVGNNIQHLVADMRRLMEPYTARSLKVKRSNHLQDFVSVAGPLNVTHFITFTKTEEFNYMRLMRLPRGPTLTFRINSYALCHDVVSSLKRQATDDKQFRHHPLLVMNGFSGEGMQFKLMTTMFQNMFPSINVNTVKLSELKRCVLLNYKDEDDTIEFRHYNVKVVPVGMSRGVKKLIKAKLPNMSRYNDVSEYLLRGGDLSESEVELDGAHNEVVLPQNVSSRGNIRATKSAIRLTEVGPRMTLQLIKIEDGISTGEVLYHKYVTKTPEEKQLTEQRRKKKKQLKTQRTQQQEENIKKKELKKLQLKEKCLAGMKKAQEPDKEFEEVEMGMPMKNSGNIMAEESEDDEDYFRQEVGEDPEPELFPKSSAKRKRSDSGPAKKRLRPTDSDSKNTQKQTKKFNKNAPRTELDIIKRRRQLKKKKEKMKMKKSGQKRGIKQSRPRKH